MRQFDQKRYLAEVLGPALGSPELPSLYERYLLDAGDADDEAIAARLDEVKRYWDKQSEHPRYGPMVRAFREQHAEAKLTLGDARQRERIAEETRNREQAEQEARRRDTEHWERLLSEVIAAGGLDPARRAQLEKLATRAGIPADVAAAKLDAAPPAAETPMLEAGVRDEIAGRLAALAQSLGEPRVGLSLFHALELEIDAEAAEVVARRDSKVAAINSTGVTNLKEAWMAVLSLIKVHLLDTDPAVYVNGLATDVREALEPEAFGAFTAGVGDEVEAEQLKRRALELGLTPELAQQVIAELARENGAVVRSGGVVDIVACPSCNFPHPRDAGDERCRKCGTALFASCPACGQCNDATSGGCSSCGADLYRHAEATRALRRLDALLDDGWLAQARHEVEAAGAVLGREGAEVAAAARRVNAASEAAKRRWDEVEAARSERRLFAMRRLLAELSGSAKDLAGPGGELPDQALDAVGERIDQAEAKFAASRGLKAEEYEQALVEVLRLVADHSDAEHELDRLPPDPPGAVEAVSGGAGMLVRWGPSPTRGAGYAVSRISVPGGVESRVGDADEPQLEDLSAPAGAVVRYAVAATRGRASSSSVRSDPVVVAPEVGRLRAAGGDGEVRLSWAVLAGAGRVVVERRDESGAAPVRIAPDAAGVSDRSVTNGQRYAYTVAVEYAGTDGGLVRTPGQTVFAEPVARPQPLRELRIQAASPGVRIGFEPPPAGTVVL
ncbi:MAG TPA: zinc ribbon domain-containing protein, partial [Solirubrobacterales bacterium]|nr:zinc ribbon domain-containing protein [Solirubrobacterales bacterium]